MGDTDRRPPVGVEPHDIWIRARKLQLAIAIVEHIQADITPPIEWLDELRGLIETNKVVS